MSTFLINIYFVCRLKTITPHISVLQSGQNTKQLITNLVQDLMNTEGRLNNYGIHSDT